MMVTKVYQGIRKQFCDGTNLDRLKMGISELLQMREDALVLKYCVINRMFEENTDRYILSMQNGSCF